MPYKSSSSSCPAVAQRENTSPAPAPAINEHHRQSCSLLIPRPGVRAGALLRPREAAEKGDLLRAGLLLQDVKGSHLFNDGLCLRG